MDMGGGNETMTMVPWLHFESGDVLWFSGWMPTTAGAMVGASFGLFFLAIVERWLSAMRVVMEAWWNRK